MSDTTRGEGPFWEAMDGRRPLPPAAAALGFELRSFDAETGELVASFAAGEQFVNAMGNVQGGFLAAMLDDTFGPALMAVLRPGQFAPTLELKVSFLRPAVPGALVGRARVLHRGGTIAFLSGELYDESDQVVATGSATARIVRT